METESDMVKVPGDLDKYSLCGGKEAKYAWIEDGIR